MNDDVIICRCQEITRKDILSAIEDGARSLDGVKRRTKGGMGLCQGKTCERLISSIIAEHTEKSIEELIPVRKRMPVRPINMGVIGGVGDE